MWYPTDFWGVLTQMTNVVRTGDDSARHVLESCIHCDNTRSQSGQIFRWLSWHHFPTAYTTLIWAILIPLKRSFITHFWYILNFFQFLFAWSKPKIIFKLHLIFFEGCFFPASPLEARCKLLAKKRWQWWGTPTGNLPVCVLSVFYCLRIFHLSFLNLVIRNGSLLISSFYLVFFSK